MAAKRLDVSEQTLRRSRQEHDGPKADEAERLKELELENGKLKRMVAEQLLENQALREIAKGNWMSPSCSASPCRCCNSGWRVCGRRIAGQHRGTQRTTTSHGDAALCARLRKLSREQRRWATSGWLEDPATYTADWTARGNTTLMAS